MRTSIECDRDECLRKFKMKAEDTVSRWCGVIGDKRRDSVIPNSTQCPLYCNKFRCYETNKTITKHEEVHWISDEKKDAEKLFRGISRIGHKKQDERMKWEREHQDTEEIVCPYCDHVHSDSYEYEMDSDSDTDIECVSCSRELSV